MRKPYLYIKISSFKPPAKREVIAFNVEIALNQQVFLRGHPDFKKNFFYAPTWYKNIVGVTSGAKVLFIRDVVKDLTDKFISAYLKANFKE